jgi:hypothetical protein
MKIVVLLCCLTMQSVRVLQMFWKNMLSTASENNGQEMSLSYPESRGNMFLRTAGNHLSDYMALHSRINNSSVLLMLFISFAYFA